MKLRLVWITAALALAVAVAIGCYPVSAAARVHRPRGHTGDVRRQARTVGPRVAQGPLPFTRLDVLLMASGCTVLLLFGAGLRLVPRRTQ